MYQPVINKAHNPKSACYPDELISLGDHIRERRLDLKLLQRDVAALLQTDTDTITNWENNRCQPGLKFYQAIMGFLGYCSWERLTGWGERLNRCRIHQGLSLAQLDRQLRVDPGTLARHLKKGPSANFRKKLAESMKSWDSFD